jgi:hypothetical protein
MEKELNLNCFDCKKSLQDCTCMEDTIDMKQESIEEAAERLYPAEWDWKEKESFIEGAEWQQERMYSEEEVLQMLFKFTNQFDLQKNIEITAEMQKEWFEQFKKK